MSPLTLMLLVGVVAAVTLISLPSADAQSGGTYMSSTQPPYMQPTSNCRKKVKQVSCITNGNKCGKDNDCCRNLFCTKTTRGSFCSRRPRSQDEAENSPISYIEEIQSTQAGPVPTTPSVPSFSA